MGNRRRSIHIDGVDHGSTPIPMGCRVRDVVYSSGIPGVDPTTGTLPPDPADQVIHVFRNVRSFLAAAGVSSDDVVRMSIVLEDDSLRAAVNEEWLALFPDADSRPARHTSVHPLRLGMHVQVEVVAVAGS